MDSVVQKEINDVVQVIKNQKGIEKIILFGSYANGTENLNSDLDFCIITNENKRKIEISWAIRELIFDIVDRPVDILVYKGDEFKERAKSKTAMEYQILKNGVVLYG